MSTIIRTRQTLRAIFVGNIRIRTKHVQYYCAEHEFAAISVKHESELGKGCLSAGNTIRNVCLPYTRIATRIMLLEYYCIGGTFNTKNKNQTKKSLSARVRSDGRHCGGRAYYATVIIHTDDARRSCFFFVSLVTSLKQTTGDVIARRHRQGE